jgi:hypothetical protein
MSDDETHEWKDRTGGGCGGPPNGCVRVKETSVTMNDANVKYHTGCLETVQAWRCFCACHE